MKKETNRQVNKIIDFLKTSYISVTFTPIGLEYLSFKNSEGLEQIDLASIEEENDQNKMTYLLIRETINFLETGRHNMPLDLSKFTYFQQNVFDAVSRIAPGSLITYKGLATILNNPGAAQAIGNAVSKNPVAYFLPTHRVISQKGLVKCKSGISSLREKLLIHEGHDIQSLSENQICKRIKCCSD